MNHFIWVRFEGLVTKSPPNSTASMSEIIKQHPYRLKRRLLKLDSSEEEPLANKLEARALVFEQPLVFRAPIRPTPIKLVKSPLALLRTGGKLFEAVAVFPELIGAKAFVPNVVVGFLFLVSSKMSKFRLVSIIGTSFNKLLKKKQLKFSFQK